MIDFSKEFGPGVTAEGVFFDSQSGTHEVRVVSRTGVVHHAVFKDCEGSDVLAWGFAAWKDALIDAPGVVVSMSGGMALARP